MGQHLQWVSIDDCINAYLSRSEQSNHKYFKLWHLCFDWLNQVGLNSFYAVQAVKLPVNANLTVTLPANYLNYSKVGVLNQQGEIIPMGFNSKLTTSFDYSPTRIEQTQDNTISTQLNEQGVWWYNVWNGGGYSNTYGLPSGAPFIGSFKIDNANGVIVLSENFSYDYVMLEYVASPQPGGEYYLPVQFKLALISYLAWMDVINLPVKTHMANSNVGMRRHDYFQELERAKFSYDPVNLPNLYQWNLEMQRLTIKA